MDYIHKCITFHRIMHQVINKVRLNLLRTWLRFQDNSHSNLPFCANSNNEHILKMHTLSAKELQWQQDGVKTLKHFYNIENV
jgi:hypothetical protein